MSGTRKRAPSSRRLRGLRFTGFGFNRSILRLLPSGGSMIFEPIAPASNGNSLGMMQKAIQDCASGGHIAQKFAPFLQRSVAGHDGGPVFIPAHDHFEK